MRSAETRQAWQTVAFGLALVLAVATTGRLAAQGPPGYAFPGGPAGPVFAHDPPPPTGPEFLPHGPPPQRTFAFPFLNPRLPKNAFFEEVDCAEPGFWYYGLGPAMFMRYPLGDGVIAVRDPAGVEPGPFPAAGQPTLVDFSDLWPQPSWGIRGLIGISDGANAWELSGFFTFNQVTYHTASNRSRMDVLFGAFPSAFQSIWLQADRVILRFENRAGNIEFNHRALASKGVEVLVGFRYFDYLERFGITTEDTAPPTNPMEVITYENTAYSHILAPQLGFALEKMLVPIVAVGAEAKAAPGLNVSNLQHSLVRGDGVEGPGSDRYRFLFSSVIDLNFHALFVLNDYIRIRAGYQLIWLAWVPQAHQQIDFNPNVGAGNVDTRGSVFLHGPVLELQLKF